jgi:hypothetical protein
MHDRKLILTPNSPHRRRAARFPGALPAVSSAPIGIAGGGWIAGRARRKLFGDERIVTSWC